MLGKVRDRYQLTADPNLTLADVPTIRDVVDYILRRFDEAPPAPADTPNEPLLPTFDVTRRRSQKPNVATSKKTASRTPVSRTPVSPASGPSVPAPADAGPTPTPAGVPSTPAPARGVSTSDEPIDTIVSAVVSRELAGPDTEAKPEPPKARDESEPVVVLRLRGTSREIGRQHGTALKNEIHALLEQYEKLAATHGLGLEQAAQLAGQLEPLFSSETRDEIRGIAEGAELPYEYVLAYNLDAALFPSYVPGCTQGWVSDDTSGPIQFVNEDSPLLVRLGRAQPRVVQIRDREGLERPRRTVLFSLAGQVCGPNAVADNGLTVTGCALLDGEPPSALPERAPHPEIVKQIIETANDIEGALEIARRASGAGRWSLLVSSVDEGRNVYLEADNGTLLLEREVDGRFVSTNHALSGPAEGREAPTHSVYRHRRATELVEADRFDVNRAKALLRDRFDLGRDRTTQHPTMNTVRRVDNVMSLVVEPSERRLHVTERVLPAGSADELEFRTISYAGDPEPTQARFRTIPPVFEAPETFDGLTGVEEIMDRHVIRLDVEAAPPVQSAFTPERALLFGSGERLEAIAATLESRGAAVEKTNDLQAAEEIIAARKPDAIGIILNTERGAPSAWTLEPKAWSERRRRFADEPFQLLRSFASARPTGTVFGVTTLGGGLGFENLPQGSSSFGALQGLLKAIKREIPTLTVQLLDTAVSAVPGRVTSALFAELDAGSPRLEVGLLRGVRVRPRLVPRVMAADAGPDALPKTWLITGGARGITATIAERLATLYRPRLHLLGRTALPDNHTLAEWRSLDPDGIKALHHEWLTEMKSEKGFSPVSWQRRCDVFARVIEIDRNLRKLEELGARVHYHAVDLANPAAVKEIVDFVRRDGAIDGVIHGAGVEVAKPFSKKTEDIYDRTVSSKVDGLVHVLSALAEAPPKQLVAFSSVSGRFGGHGQTDYSLANELMARITTAFGNAHSDTSTCVIDWPAWSEVGMAARSSARKFLEEAGQAFMHPAEGGNHFLRELWAGLPEAELTICGDLELIDGDRQMPDRASREPRIAMERDASLRPMLGSLISHDERRTVFERHLDPAEPFLDQHRIGQIPILPGVIGLEALSELAALVEPGATVEQVRIVHPLKVRPDRPVSVRIIREGDRVAVTHMARTEAGVVLDTERVQLEGRLVRRASKLEPALGLEEPSELVPYPYPDSLDPTPGSRLIFHGPVFRCLEGVKTIDERHAVARLIVPPVESLVPGSAAGNWCIPAALLDGCLQAAGLVGRMLHGITALPVGFGRIDLLPRILHATGETVRLEITMERIDASRLSSDLLVVGADGPLFSVKGYEAQGVPGSAIP